MVVSRTVPVLFCTRPSSLARATCWLRLIAGIVGCRARRSGAACPPDPRWIGSDGFESTVLWLGSLGFHIAQVSEVMTTKTRIQTGPQNLGIKELRHHGQKIVKRHQKRLAQGHYDGLLRGRQRRLQPVRPCGCNPQRYHACAISTPSVPSSHGVPQEPRQAHRWPELPL